MKKNEDEITYAEWLKFAKGKVPDPIWNMFNDMGEEFWKDNVQLHSSFAKDLFSSGREWMKKKGYLQRLIGLNFREICKIGVEMSENLVNGDGDIIDVEFSKSKKNEEEEIGID